MSKKILVKALDRIIKKGQLQINFADGTTARFGEAVEGLPDVVVRYADNRVPWDIVRDPDLGMTEAVIEGRVIFERSDILGLATVLRVNNRFEETGSPRHLPMWRRVANKIGFELQQMNTALRSKANVAHHYDIGNDLYGLMLDPEHWQYSCGYWPRAGMTLGEAQTAKLAHIAAKLALEPGQEVLDIGCGWGGMAIFIARHHDVHVTGITLSQEQAALARNRAADAGVAERVSIELIDYRDLAASGRKFDRIVSVGMFEHVGKAQFETFFRACSDLLTREGVMLLHTIGRMGPPGVTDAFTRKYIFPGGYIPSMSETMAASEKSGLMATDTEIWRLHYAKTIRQWYANCLAHREEIVAMFDERFFRMWTMYLAGAATVFEYGPMCNFQIQYARDRRTLPLARDYMIEVERALLGD